MATPTIQGSNTGSDSIIAGYFQDGESAHRAINALLDQGFLASQIGAAFHTNGGAQGGSDGSSTAAASKNPDLGTTFDEEAADLDTSDGGPSSGTTAVQPAGLSTGSGSVILGAGAPGPITGSETTNTGLPHELHSELAHDQPGTAQATPPPTTYTATEPKSSKSDSSWGAKLKHLFQSKKTETAGSGATEESQNFGSGSGHLNLTEPYGQPYSPTAFESSISGVGVPSDHSRQLSQRLSGGGAVVTVSETGRAVEVEKIFEQYGGVVRFASSVFDDSPALDYEPRVEVFGHLEHRYPVL